MDTAGDVEKQAMPGIERHQRRKAVAPLGNGIQCLGIRGFIGIEYLQLRTDGAGIGEWQAWLKAEPRGGIIQRGNQQRIVLFGDDDAWVSRRGVAAPKLAFDTVDGQARQPQAEDTPPVCWKGTHKISIPLYTA